jgi:hypothetical protein
MNVEVVKLVTGEELISDVEHTETGVTCKNPMLVAVQDGRLVFIPYMQYTFAAKLLTLKSKDIMFVVTPVDTIIADYENATAEITKPRKSIISSVP